MVVKKIDKVRWRKKRCWYNYKQFLNHSDFSKYKEVLGTAAKTIRNAMRSSEGKLSLYIKDNPKAFYKYARSET